MSEIDDINEFVTAASNYPERNATTPGASLRSIRDLFGDQEEDSKDQNKMGQPVQYSHYGAGFTPTSSTIKTLPSGCYDVQADDRCVFVTPAASPSGLLLELPEMRSDEVIKIVDVFWNSEKDYKEGNEFVIGGANYKAGIMIYGPPGCHAKGTEVLMFDGSFKKVEDVEIGDQLMGPDSKPREVLKLKRGQEELVKITPVKGDSFVINKSHILHLTPSGKEVLTQTPINMKFSDWLEQGSNFKLRYKLTRTGVEFSERSLPIEPYMLGMWIGDGTSHITDITTMDTEIVDHLVGYTQKHNMNLVKRESVTKGKASTYGITNGIGQKNPLLTSLQELELIRNKHIPGIYKTSSRDQRLSLLAGLMDSDGHLNNGTFDFVSKFERLADDVVYLARSLGFAAYKQECEKSCQNDFTGTYFRVGISGEVSEIPCLLPRKQAEKRKQIKSVLRTGFSYEMLPVGEFYGFTLDEDHLYLTSDFMIHHNSGKSCTIKLLSKKLVERGGTVFYASGHPAHLMRFLGDFSKIEKDRKCIVILEDIDSLIQAHGESIYLEMLDSAKTISNVLFIATTNYPDRLDPRIYNRPGRFSHVIKIGLPSEETRRAYLKAILKDHRDVEYIVENSANFTIDHLTSAVNSVYREKKNLEQELKRLRALFRVPKVEESGSLRIGGSDE